MIHIDRRSVEVPSALVGEDSKAARELSKAKLHFEQKKTGSFGFKIYKDPTVKKALEDLFHGKCAYCECVYAANQPVDIEHYRPKSGYMLNGKLVKPGYWWLAADWENLLPSCIDCNRRRKQEEVGGGEILKLGKASLFPIADESQRAGREGEEENERRLLLDPCRDRPERYLAFGEQGEVKAQEGIAPLDLRTVEESMNVYGLNRSGLASRRRNLVLDLGGKVSALVMAKKAWVANKSESSRAEFAEVLGHLLRKRRDDEEFAGLVRHFIDKFIPNFRAMVEGNFQETSAEPIDDLVFLERFVERFAAKKSLSASLAGLLGG